MLWEGCSGDKWALAEKELVKYAADFKGIPGATRTDQQKWLQNFKIGQKPKVSLECTLLLCTAFCWLYRLSAFHFWARHSGRTFCLLASVQSYEAWIQSHMRSAIRDLHVY